MGYGVGYANSSSNGHDLPLFERYFPGGINSVRGFADRSLGPKENGDVVGGDKQAIMNVELLFPIMEQYGLRGSSLFRRWSSLWIVPEHKLERVSPVRWDGRALGLSFWPAARGARIPT